TVSILKEYGYNVLAASDGADAVALYAQNKDKIKVVLMDLMMPVMDGEASIRAIRKLNPHIKVIVGLRPINRQSVKLSYLKITPFQN
ncbi:MAG: response regulator, partial [Candidatus Methanoperedens sp.]|nr:response regulator [Candidatus Methanoperedens sp.]